MTGEYSIHIQKYLMYLIVSLRDIKFATDVPAQIKKSLKGCHNMLFSYFKYHEEGSMMVKVKHFLVLLNVGMAVVCLVALGVLQEKFSRPLYRQRFAKYSVPKHKALAVIQDQDSATMLKSRDLTVLSQSTSHQIESETKLEDLISSGNPYVDLILTRIVGHQSQVQEEPRQRGQFNNLVVSPIYPRIVIYNRVPKCASATMWRICRSYILYLNFTRFGYWEPTWINIVRHPVKRLISHYYFKGPLQTLDTCIETGVCNFEKNMWLYD
ncbi:uncharacterized protein LOC122261391 [Penaeus japonicus]|uniref:uncharacterized protein LOC122261391 n=1 Tax=Penaeus japonicus TaxID=27405 RepID=UPI001C717806|nr:uncharacterized protein LOC122261391 [Penaeus japonicus]